MKPIKIQTFHHEFRSLFQLLIRFSVRAGGLNIVVVFQIVDPGVCHEALVMLPNNLIKRQGNNRQLFPHNEENVSK